MELTEEVVPFLDLDAKDFKDYNDLVDNLEKRVSDNLPLINLPLSHTITPGLYTREMFAPKGVLITSKPHLTKHQFIVSKGKILIYDERSNEWCEVSAPYRGVTEPYTRRIGYVLEDVVWTTIHPTPLVEDRDYTKEEFVALIKTIEEGIIDPRTNKLLNT